MKHTHLCHAALEAIVGGALPCVVVDAVVVELAAATADSRLPADERERARRELRWIQATSEGIAARSAR